MRIYQSEKNDGIDFQLNKAGSSTAFVTAQVKVCDIKKYFDGMSVSDLVKATSTIQTVEELLGQEQPDLALVVAILVSTGWNLNDDIFTPAEVWKARSTPLHKPMNDNHDAEKIIGHIVKSRVLDKDGTEIADDSTPPDEFDIEVAGVLYRAFPELSDRIDEIITKAKAGEMFVSMEAWFPDFGYGLIDPITGETKLIDRNESTAFLTKHLRVHGGSGQYQEFKIGRVLKDIIFGAQGFVDTPANPESVIKVAAKKLKLAASSVFVTAELNEISKGGVEDVDEKQSKELQDKLAEAIASLESKEKEVAKLQDAAKELSAKDYVGQITVLTEKVDGLTAKVTEANGNVESVEVAKDKIQKQLDEAIANADRVESQLEEIRKNETGRERLVKLSDVKEITDEEATLAELREMTDETFDLVLRYAGEVKSEKVVAKAGDTKVKEDKNDTNNDDDSEKIKATLDNVKEDDSADFNASEDAAQTEAKSWADMGQALCGRVEEKE